MTGALPGRDGGTGGPGGDGSMGLTRWRDLALVALVAAVIGYLAVRWSYQRLPGLPALAGLPALVIGAGEAVYGLGLRRRIRDSRTGRRPVDGLSVARALVVAKATALAGAAVAGLWVGVLGYVVPAATTVAAAGSDRTSATIGLGCAIAMTAGALWLERCCRAPDDQQPPDPHRYPHQT